jgi:toxin CcdB
MPQFTLHANANAATKELYPYLLDVQSPLFETLDTRLSIPLILASKYKGQPLSGLSPTVRVKGADYLMLASQMAGVQRTAFGPAILDLTAKRQEILAAIDFLLTGF